MRIALNESIAAICAAAVWTPECGGQARDTSIDSDLSIYRFNARFLKNGDKTSVPWRLRQPVNPAMFCGHVCIYIHCTLARRTRRLLHRAIHCSRYANSRRVCYKCRSKGKEKSEKKGLSRAGERSTVSRSAKPRFRSDRPDITTSRTRTADDVTSSARNNEKLATGSRLNLVANSSERQVTWITRAPRLLSRRFCVL